MTKGVKWTNLELTFAELTNVQGCDHDACINGWLQGVPDTLRLVDSFKNIRPMGKTKLHFVENFCAEMNWLDVSIPLGKIISIAPI